MQPRKSSIHIEKGHTGYLFHNDRSKPTANSIFDRSYNEVYPNTAIEALEIYNKHLKERIQKYTERTGKKLHKNTITHLSAIVNLNEKHTLEDVKKIANYLEENLGTKVFQIAVHGDEGYIDEETGEKHINFHAHLEFLGLDEQGNSVRRKLTRSFLRDLQTKTAEILQMRRGQINSKRKRLDTYEYKEHARLQSKYKNAVKILQNFAKDNFNFKIKNKDDLLNFLNKIKNKEKAIKLLKENSINSIDELQEFLQKNAKEEKHSFFAKIFAKKENKKELDELKKENEELKKELAKVKDLKELNKQLRKELKESGAAREQYAQLENYVKELKEQVKAKNLTIEKLKMELNDFREKLNLKMEPGQQKQNEDAKELERKLKKEKEERKKEQEKVKEFINELLDTEYKLRKELTKQTQKNKELKKIVEDKDKKINELKKQLEEYKNMRYIERKELEEEISELRKQIRKLKNSQNKSKRFKL